MAANTHSNTMLSRCQLSLRIILFLSLTIANLRRSPLLPSVETSCRSTYTYPWVTVGEANSRMKDRSDALAATPGIKQEWALIETTSIFKSALLKAGSSGWTRTGVSDQGAPLCPSAGASHGR